MGERDTNTHVYFWRTKSPFSQWYNAGFHDEDGYYYRTAEHYMMVGKARLMGDEKNASLILKCKCPRKVKALGRKVKNWNETLYRQHREEIVTKGNYYKFSQNPALKDILLQTTYKILVEASPYDKIWGIGLAPEDDAILDENNWIGQNLLGKCLMNVRDMLLEEQEEVRDDDDRNLFPDEKEKQDEKETDEMKKRNARSNL